MSYDDIIDNFMAWNPEVHLNNIIHDICASPQFFLTGIDPKQESTDSEESVKGQDVAVFVSARLVPMLSPF